MGKSERERICRVSGSLDILNSLFRNNKTAQREGFQEMTMMIRCENDPKLFWNGVPLFRPALTRLSVIYSYDFFTLPSYRDYFGLLSPPLFRLKIFSFCSFLWTLFFCLLLWIVTVACFNWSSLPPSLSLPFAFNFTGVFTLRDRNSPFLFFLLYARCNSVCARVFFCAWRKKLSLKGERGRRKESLIEKWNYFYPSGVFFSIVLFSQDFVFYLSLFLISRLPPVSLLFFFVFFLSFFIRLFLIYLDVIVIVIVVVTFTIAPVVRSAFIHQSFFWNRLSLFCLFQSIPLSFYLSRSPVCLSVRCLFFCAMALVQLSTSSFGWFTGVSFFGRCVCLHSLSHSLTPGSVSLSTSQLIANLSA